MMFSKPTVWYVVCNECGSIHSAYGADDLAGAVSTRERLQQSTGWALYVKKVTSDVKPKFGQNFNIHFQVRT